MSVAYPPATAYDHIRLDEDGAPFIVGATMKVVELVMAPKARGWSPEELHFQRPYLTMSQIYSALAYYWEQKEALDADIQRRLRPLLKKFDTAVTFDIMPIAVPQ